MLGQTLSAISAGLLRRSCLLLQALADVMLLMHDVWRSQEFGTDRQADALVPAQRRFGVSVSAAHVCAVLALPPPASSNLSSALHGHRYLAVDLFPVSTGLGKTHQGCSQHLSCSVRAVHFCVLASPRQELLSLVSLLM